MNSRLKKNVITIVWMTIALNLSQISQASYFWFRNDSWELGQPFNQATILEFNDTYGYSNFAGAVITFNAAATLTTVGALLHPGGYNGYQVMIYDNSGTLPYPGVLVAETSYEATVPIGGSFVVFPLMPSDYIQVQPGDSLVVAIGYITYDDPDLCTDADGAVYHHNTVFGLTFPPVWQFAEDAMFTNDFIIRIGYESPDTPTPAPTSTPTYTPVSSTNTPTNTPTALTLTPTMTPTVLTPTASPTYSPTTTYSPTISPTLTPSPTPTHSPTASSTLTPTVTGSATYSPTWSPTTTLSPTLTPTLTLSPTLSPTFTASPTYSPTLSPTLTISPTLSPTLSPTVTNSATVTHTPTRSPTPTNSATVTPTPTGTLPTHTPTATPTFSPTLTLSPTWTMTEVPATATQSPTQTATSTLTPTVTLSPTISPTYSPTSTLTPTNTQSPTATGTWTPTFSPSPTVTWSPTLSPTGSATLTPTMTMTDTPTLTPTMTGTLTATLTPSATPSVPATATPYYSETPTPTVTPTLTATPTATRIPYRAPFFDDFEYPDTGWTIDHHYGSVNLWHYETARYTSFAHSWAFNRGDPYFDYNLPERLSGSLVSPPVFFADAVHPTMKFYYWLQNEGRPDFDICVVEIKEIPDGEWQTLTIIYEEVNVGVWNLQQHLDLSGYNNKKFVVRFRFDTIDEQHNNFEGLYIDDVFIFDDRTVPNAPTAADEPEYTIGLQNMLHWSDESASGAVTYLAQCAATPDFTNPVESGWISETSYTFTGLTHNVKYYYRVRAQNPWGEVSGWSNTTFSTQDSVSPEIWCTGYWDTYITYTSGGTLIILTYTPDTDVRHIEIYYDDLGTGIYLRDQGEDFDGGPNDGLYGFVTAVGNGVGPSTFYFSVVATDFAGNQTDATILDIRE